MRLMTLNLWGGRAGKCVVDFITVKGEGTDIFCFQEVFDGGESEQSEIDQHQTEKQYDLYTKIQAALPDHIGYFRPSLGDWYGLAIFVRKGIQVDDELMKFVHGDNGTIPENDLGHHSRIIQDLVIRHEDKKLHIVNFHGLWNGKGKSDSPARLDQSKRIIKYLESVNGEEVILCGDFNLTPETESLNLIRSYGFRDLIEEFQVTSTRTPRYTKPIKYADYIFATPGVIVESFTVLPDDVSDHAALYLDFDIYLNLGGT